MFNSMRSSSAAAVLAIAAAGIFATAAAASPGSGTTPENFTTGTLPDSVHFNSDRVKFQTKDATLVRVQRLTFAPGAYTGWHHHPGVVVVAVESGSLTITHSNCSDSTTYSAGDVFVEGSDESHEARSPEGAVIYVTYVVPHTSPIVPTTFRTEDPVPFCATTF